MQWHLSGSVTIGQHEPISIILQALSCSLATKNMTDHTASVVVCAYRRKEQPSWLLLLKSRDFGAIALVNALMFATANGSRSVLMPLLARQSFAISNTVLGRPHCEPAVFYLVLATCNMMHAPDLPAPMILTS